MTAVLDNEDRNHIQNFYSDHEETISDMMDKTRICEIVQKNMEYGIMKWSTDYVQLEDFMRASSEIR